MANTLTWETSLTTLILEFFMEFTSAAERQHRMVIRVDIEELSAWLTSVGVVLFAFSLALPSVVLGGGEVVFGAQCFGVSVISVMSLAVSSHPVDKFYELFISMDPVPMLKGWGMLANGMSAFAVLLRVFFVDGLRLLQAVLSVASIITVALLAVLPLSPYRGIGSLVSISYLHVGFCIWLVSLALIAAGSTPALQFICSHRSGGTPRI